MNKINFYLDIMSEIICNFNELHYNIAEKVINIGRSGRLSKRFRARGMDESVDAASIIDYDVKPNGEVLMFLQKMLNPIPQKYQTTELVHEEMIDLGSETRYRPASVKKNTLARQGMRGRMSIGMDMSNANCHPHEHQYHNKITSKDFL